MIFGFQFVLIGLLGEMIRYFAFQPNKEYCVSQEYAIHDDVQAYVPFIPGEVQRQKVSQGTWEQALYPRSTQGWGQWQVDSPGNGHNGSKDGIRNSNIPHRPTMVRL
jgi:hypothetical protein